MSNDSEKRNVEDYGGSADEDMGGQSGGSMQGNSDSGGVGQFGEFEDTGVGTDLTVEMENTDARSGMVKGGEVGADDVAGPGQYGGEAGGLSR